MVGALGAGDLVPEGVVAMAGLHELLQAPFGVVGGRVGEALSQRAVDPQHDAAGGGQVAVEVERADNGLKRILQCRRAGAAATGFLAAAEAQAGIEPEFARELEEKHALGEGGAALAEFALTVGGKKLEQRLGQHELKHGVTEELEPLVGLGLARVVLQPGRVCDGGGQQLRVAKRVADPVLELGQRGAHELALE